MNNAIVTLVTGDFWDIAKVTMPTLQAYADKIGVKLHVITERKFAHVHYEKWQMYTLPFDRMFYIDVDCVVTPNCPDIFSEVCEGVCGAYDELHLQPNGLDRINAVARQLGYPEITSLPFYMNGGVYCIDHEQRYLIRPPEEIIAGNLPEQDHFNFRLQTANVCTLDHRWNCLQEYMTGNYLRTAYIIHYAGFTLRQKIKRAKSDIHRLSRIR